MGVPAADAGTLARSLISQRPSISSLYTPTTVKTFLTSDGATAKLIANPKISPAAVDRISAIEQMLRESGCRPQSGLETLSDQDLAIMCSG